MLTPFALLHKKGKEKKKPREQKVQQHTLIFITVAEVHTTLRLVGAILYQISFCNLPRPGTGLGMLWKPEPEAGPVGTFLPITVDTSICWSLRSPWHRVVRVVTSWWRRSQCCSHAWRSMLNCSCSRSLISCSAGVKFCGTKRQLYNSYSTSHFFKSALQHR